MNLVEFCLIRKIGLFISVFCVGFLFSQQKVSGRITDDNKINLSSVLVFNVTKNIRTLSDISGNFAIDADENDEIRFVKEGYYRTDKIIKKESFNNQIDVVLLRAETLIPEVKISYKPTGNLEKDSKHYSDSRKIAALKSSMDAYIKSPMNVPIPVNEIPKTFQAHDFNAGQVNLIKVFGEAVRLVKKASAPKITAPTYGETQSFLARVKTELDLSFLTKLGMNDERIDHFILYAERVKHL
ncbi:hypothetical protein [Chryseobacterium wangxinyae]|uniref:hypothetical protein n=1 Tax=Chryseobacterium sp. CY353 TaxID=2997334 RepID=UPI00226FB462|nr:hypothetical protein [Chryseobacterium sp. CY353]MCY0970611.1 hypothetical protein [Chryseobacterium sp. CY353]